MDLQAPPQRKLRKIRRKPATVKYGYGEQYEGTPEQAAAFQEAFQKELGYSPSYAYAAPVTPKLPRVRGKVRTMSLPRTRSREQSHAPRSTPKAAKRSGDSGDSDPPGEPAAHYRRREILAAEIQAWLRRQAGATG